MLPNRIASVLLFTGLLGFLTGCAYLPAGPAFVQVSSTTYWGPGSELRGSIIVLPVDEKQRQSLQFQSLSARLLEDLYKKGYTKPGPDERPQYVAYLTYGINDGSTRTSSVPIYGPVGGGTSFTTGQAYGSGGSASFNATTTSMPMYGITGSMPVSSTEYRRELNIDIFKVDTTDYQKIFEIRARSVGTCGNLSAIIPDILDSVAAHFPGKNGKTESYSSLISSNC